MRYVISYDISDDKRRRKVVKVLEGVGYRVQYSVFEADLSRKQLADLQKRLKPYVKPKTTESIRFYQLCADCRKVKVYGTDLARSIGGVLVV